MVSGWGKWARSASGPYHLSPSSFVLKAFVLCLLSSVLKREEDKGEDGRQRMGRDERTKDRGQKTEDVGLWTLDFGRCEKAAARWRCRSFF